MIEYTLKKIEIVFDESEKGYTLFIERDECFVDPESGTQKLINRWRSPIYPENESDLVGHLTRDQIKANAKFIESIEKRLKPIIKLIQKKSDQS